ncbi:MAG: hypothetical protein R3B65_03035 [Candidatus Paceibacterota bacterium]
MRSRIRDKITLIYFNVHVLDIGISRTLIIYDVASPFVYDKEMRWVRN